MRRRHVQLIKLRNPWGNYGGNESRSGNKGRAGAFTGAWAEWSEEWQLVSRRELHRLNLSFENNGDFFMSFEVTL